MTRLRMLSVGLADLRSCRRRSFSVAMLVRSP